MNRALKSTLFSLFLLSGFFFYAHAQNVPGISDPITFRMIPQNPNPSERVDLSAQSFSTDLNKAVFKWYVNGKLHAEGVGMKSISVSSGQAGSFTSVRVEISTSDFGVITNEFAFRPAEVVLMWEADTYTPPFYKGKAAHSFGGTFKVTALPEFFSASGKRINPKDLIYTWKKNGEVQGDASGFAKDSYITSQTSYLRDGEEISVEVSSPRENYAGSASVTIRPSVPEVLFYENSPLYGVIYERSLRGTHTLANEEMTLKAEPFGMSTDGPTSGLLTFSWNLNGAMIAEFANRNQIVLRKVDGSAGQSSLGVTVQNSRKLLQGAQSSITISQ
ncbi:MAG TPA: hypothetical protein VGE35_00130 [Candidatus Paceibacterota bacterium]